MGCRSISYFRYLSAIECSFIEGPISEKVGTSQLSYVKLCESTYKTKQNETKPKKTRFRYRKHIRIRKPVPGPKDDFLIKRSNHGIITEDMLLTKELDQ